MKIVAGLGNPGAGYAGTRHNAGYMVVDRIAASGQAQFRASKFKAESAETRIGAERVLLLKPRTYMNLSGQAVAGAALFYKVEPSGVLVVMDDMDLPLGKLRARPGGGSGGHKGLLSVMAELGTEDVPRLKIGIGRDPARGGAEFVLGRFSGEEAGLVDSAVARACDAVSAWVTEGIDSCMNRFNAADVEGGEFRRNDGDGNQRGG